MDRAAPSDGARQRGRALVWYIWLRRLQQINNKQLETVISITDRYVQRAVEQTFDAPVSQVVDQLADAPKIVARRTESSSELSSRSRSFNSFFLRSRSPTPSSSPRFPLVDKDAEVLAVQTQEQIITARESQNKSYPVRVVSTVEVQKVRFSDRKTAHKLVLTWTSAVARSL